ncbi:MAG: MBL fold metallo-hydrolase [Alphaproteobacteria bacterium]
MKIQIIGADSAFDGLNTSFFFRDELDRGVLVDCGFTVFPELNRRNMLNDVDVVLISHLHADHSGSLTLLAAYSRILKKQKIKIGGADVSGLFREQGILPDDFVQLSSDDLLNLKIIQTDHIPEHGNNNALFIANSILYSGNTCDSVLENEFAENAKVIFHDTRLKSPISYGHTPIETLNNAAPEIKAKTWLIHIPTKERKEIETMAQQMGFAGVCYNGQEIEI